MYRYLFGKLHTVLIITPDFKCLNCLWEVNSVRQQKTYHINELFSRNIG